MTDIAVIEQYDEIQNKWECVAYIGPNRWDCDLDIATANVTLRVRYINRQKEAFRILQKYNRLHNDRDAYLYEVVRWATIPAISKPDPKDYGLEE